jgi:hypothetical protein
MSSCAFMFEFYDLQLLDAKSIDFLLTALGCAMMHMV